MTFQGYFAFSSLNFQDIPPEIVANYYCPLLIISSYFLSPSSASAYKVLATNPSPSLPVPNPQVVTSIAWAARMKAASLDLIKITVQCCVGSLVDGSA
jgi:hypothetical protein